MGKIKSNTLKSYCNVKYKNLVVEIMNIIIMGAFLRACVCLTLFWSYLRAHEL